MKPTPTLAEMIASFDPNRHGGEVMATDPIGVEWGDIVAAATRVFKSEALAKGWLHTQVPELDGDIPVIVLMEEGGFERVLKALEVREKMEACEERSVP